MPLLGSVHTIRVSASAHMLAFAPREGIHRRNRFKTHPAVCGTNRPLQLASPIMCDEADLRTRLLLWVLSDHRPPGREIRLVGMLASVDIRGMCIWGQKTGVTRSRATTEATTRGSNHMSALPRASRCRSGGGEEGIEEGLKTDVDAGGTEAGASIEPVIIAQFVDLDTLPIRRLMRHRLCRHRQRVVGVEIGSQATVVLEQLGREIEMLLKREFRVGLTEEGKRSQLFDLMGRRALGDGRARDGSDEEVGVRSGLSCSSFGVTVVMQICAVACAGRGSVTVRGD